MNTVEFDVCSSKGIVVDDKIKQIIHLPSKNAVELLLGIW